MVEDWNVSFRSEGSAFQSYSRSRAHAAAGLNLASRLWRNVSCSCEQDDSPESSIFYPKSFLDYKLRNFFLHHISVNHFNLLRPTAS